MFTMRWPLYFCSRDDARRPCLRAGSDVHACGLAGGGFGDAWQLRGVAAASLLAALLAVSLCRALASSFFARLAAAATWRSSAIAPLRRARVHRNIFSLLPGHASCVTCFSACTRHQRWAGSRQSDGALLWRCWRGRACENVFTTSHTLPRHSPWRDLCAATARAADDCLRGGGTVYLRLLAALSCQRHCTLLRWRGLTSTWLGMYQTGVCVSGVERRCLPRRGHGWNSVRAFNWRSICRRTCAWRRYTIQQATNIFAALCCAFNKQGVVLTAAPKRWRPSPDNCCL